MNVIQIVAGILNAAVLIYILVLLARLVFEWIPVFDREWRPRGAMLVVAEGVYTATDPPIRFLRRFIPPLRIGSIAIDCLARVLLALLLRAPRLSTHVARPKSTRLSRSGSSRLLQRSVTRPSSCFNFGTRTATGL